MKVFIADAKEFECYFKDMWAFIRRLYEEEITNWRFGKLSLTTI